MADDPKNMRGEARLDQGARAGRRASVPEYEIAAQAVREKMARLKALRLARDAAEPKSPVSTNSSSKGVRSVERSSRQSSASKSKASLSDWLDEQKGSGRKS